MMSAVGDAVHVLPIVNALKRAYPSTHITWILKPIPATLVRGHPAVDEILEVDTARGMSAFRDAARALRERPFDLVLALQVYFKAGIITRLTRAPVKLGFDVQRARDLNWLFTTHRIPPHERQHVQDQYFEFLTALRIPHEPIEWRLGPWPSEREWQEEFRARVGVPFAVIVPTASNEERDWIPERWGQVVDDLVERHSLRSVIAGGGSPREQAAAAAIVRHARHRPLVELGAGLRRLVSMIDASALALSVDTGAVHVAVALDRPVVTLMGNADPGRTGPYRRFRDLVVDAYHDPGEDTTTVNWSRRAGRMPRIQVSDVLEKVALWADRYR